MLGLLANKMFFDPEDPEQKRRHPNPYGRMLEVINIYNPDEYRKKLKPNKVPFNCQDPQGFRLGVTQPKDTKLSELEKERLKNFKE